MNDDDDLLESRMEFRLSKKLLGDFEGACDENEQKPSEVLRRWMLIVVLRHRAGKDISPTIHDHPIIGPFCRTMTDEELNTLVEKTLADRPIEPPPAPSRPRGRPRKS